jgi:hypothetical protein
MVSYIRLIYISQKVQVLCGEALDFNNCAEHANRWQSTSEPYLSAYIPKALSSTLKAKSTS